MTARKSKEHPLLTLDHLAYSATDLAKGVALAEAGLGRGFAGGGQHPQMATHNRLLGLGEDYLEVIAIDPGAAPPDRPRWFDLDRFQGALRLTNWVARCDDLEAALALCPPGMGEPMQLERGPYRWRMAVPSDGILPFDGCFPALIEWQGPAHPAQVLPDHGLRLTQLLITHPLAAELRAALAGVLRDPRVVVTSGTLGMAARFDGPEGSRWLS